MARFRRTRACKRPGKILLAMALLMPVFLGVVALVFETGLMMSRQGQLRDLADSAARIAAGELLRGGTSDDAADAAQTFFNQHLPAAFGAMPDLQVESPPGSGPYAGDSHYVEVRLTGLVTTTFAQFLGGQAQEPVSARAVAGFERISRGARIIALNGNAMPGVRIMGNGVVRVEGGVMVNSRGGGLSEDGDVLGPSPDALVVGNNSPLYADDVQVVGGVNDPANVVPLDATERPPLRTGCLAESDPLANLPVPTDGLLVDTTLRGFAVVNGGAAMISNGNTVAADGWVELHPGIYDYIHITGGQVRLLPGIFVLRGGNPTTLKITGGQVDGTAGVMFYNTGNDFEILTGQPDILDTAATVRPATTQFGNVLITSSPQLRPLNNGSAWDGMLFMQRRCNDETIIIAGNGQPGAMVGTLYARDADLSITGQGTFDTNLVVGSLSKTGTGNLTLTSSIEAPVAATKVFLVE